MVEEKVELENRDYTTDEPQFGSVTYDAQPPDEGLRAYLFDVSRALGKEDTVMVDVDLQLSFQERLLHQVSNGTCTKRWTHS